MLKSIITLVSLFIASTVTAQTSWTPMLSNTTANVYGIAFTPDTTGWAVTFNPAQILKSTDHGWEWSVNYTIPDVVLKCVFFANDTLGWVGGGDVSNNQSVMFRTVDGGETWDPVTINNNCGTSINYIKVIEVNASGTNLDGFAFGHNGQTFKSLGPSNGTWGSYCNAPGHIWSGYIVDRDVSFIAADQLCMRTEWGGLWEVVYNNNVRGVDFANDTLAYGLTASDIIRSTDAGLTWMEVSSSPLGSISIGTIAAGESGVVYAGGTDGEIYISQDEGVTWFQNRQTEVGRHITHIAKFNGRVWATGYNGLIESRSDYVSGVEDGTISFEPRIWPNPTLGTVQLDLSSYTDAVSISVYDLLGELVQTEDVRHNGVLKYQMPETEGVYLVKLSSSEGNTTVHKVIKW